MTDHPDPQPPPEVDDRATREPFYGSCFGLLSLGALVGGPVWVLMFAVIHATAVARVFQSARDSGVPIDELGVSVWSVAASIPMILSSGAQSFVLTLLLLVLIAAGLIVLRTVAARLDARLSQRAISRYAADAADGAILTPDSWTRDLPEPDPVDVDTSDPAQAADEGRGPIDPGDGAVEAADGPRAP